MKKSKYMYAGLQSDSQFEVSISNKEREVCIHITVEYSLKFSLVLLEFILKK